MAFANLIVFLSFAAIALGTPAPRAPLRQLVKIDGEVTGRYLVTLKESTEIPDVLGVMSSSVVQQWGNFHGFVVEGNDDTLTTLLSHPEVEMVEEDATAHTCAFVAQEYATWGIARMSTQGQIVDGDFTMVYPYVYDESAGEGVDIYILDTGIDTENIQFEGRARWGTTFGDYEDRDGVGHGTHVAGTAVSLEFGMAKKAEVIAVKVLGDDGSGTFADILSGMDWVLSEAAGSGRPSVVSMSLGGPASITVDRAVARLTDAGIHVVVAAGNDGNDAYLYSPARAPSANTVGATDIEDNAAVYTNIGSSVDIFAPGTMIVSTWISAPYWFLSGTSMATPHVSGMIATLISADGNLTPAEMSAKIKSLAQKDIIGNMSADTPNLFAHNGAATAGSLRKGMKDHKAEASYPLV